MSSLWLMVVTCMLRSSYCRCLKLIASNSPCWFRYQEKTMRSYPLSSRKNTQGRGSCSTAFCMRLAWSRSGSSRPAADAAAARLALHPIGRGRPVVGSVMRYWPGVVTVSHRSGWRWFHCSMPASIASIGLCPSAGLMAKDSVARVTSPAIVFRCTMVSPGS